MDYSLLMNIHLITVLPCVVIGGVLLIIKKGTNIHKLFGWVLMMFTALVTLFMPAQVGPTVLNHFGWIHLFSFLTIYTVPTALIAIKKGRINAHKRKMVLLYFGALIIAGGFTLMPGRHLHQLLFE